MASSTSIEDTLEQLTRGLDQLRVDLRKRARETAKTVRKDAPIIAKHARQLTGQATDRSLDYARGWLSSGKKALNTAGGSVDELRENALAVASHAREIVSDALEQADRYSRPSRRKVEGFVRERPVASLAIVGLAGLVLGRLLSRD